MSPPFRQLGRVLAESPNETRTRPSFRPPPNLALNLSLRRAALRPFGVLANSNSREVATMPARK
jgi:hypothetical protein